MKDKIIINLENLIVELDFKESDSWEQVKYETLGAVHRILLARDTGKNVIGVVRKE